MKAKGLRIILTAVLIAAVLSGCKKNVGTPEDNAVVEETEDDAPEGNRLLGYSCADLSVPFYGVLKDSVGSALEEQGDRILVRDAKGDPQTQETQIQELIDAGVEAVFLCPADPQEITESLEMLKEADIPVINLAVRVAETDLTEAFVGSDDENAGKICGEDLLEKLPDGGKIVIVESPENAVFNARITGFEVAVANKGFEVIKRINGENESTGIEKELTDILTKGTQVNAVMCADDQMALSVLEALDAAGKKDIFVYSVGGSPGIKSALASINSPMAGIGAQSPINMGKEAVRTATAILNGEKYEKEISVETFFINRANLDMYGTDGWQ